MLIVNADDFGYSLEVNDAIVRAFREGSISSATLMANMPGFENACLLAKRYDLTGRLGVHLNITEGVPLTRAILRCPAFSAAGSTLAFVRGSKWVLGRADAAALREEIEAQLARCRAQGIAPTHVDSHHHFHTELPVFLPILPLLKRHAIRFVRLSDNVRKCSVPRRIYKCCFNGMLGGLGLRGTDYFCDAEGFANREEELLRQNVATEIMVHPVYGARSELLDGAGGPLLKDAVARALGRTRLSSYAELAHARSGGLPAAAA